MRDNFNTGQATVGLTPTLVVAQNTGRKAVVITNTTTTAVYLSYGSNTAVGPNCTTTAGQLLPGVVGASIAIPSTSAVWGVGATGATGSTFVLTFLDS